MSAKPEQELFEKCARRMAREGLDYHPVGLRRGVVPCGCPAFYETHRYENDQRVIVLHAAGCPDA